MSYPSIPWKNLPQPDPNLIGTITSAINQGVQAGEQVVEQVVPQAEAVIPAVTDQVTAVVEQGVANAAAPVGGAIATDISGVIEVAAKAAIQEAQESVAKRVQNAITESLSSLGEPQLATIPSGDLKKIDAWERAGRTFLTGLVVTILAALVQVIGDALSNGQVDFFTKTGWTAVGTLAVGSSASSVFTYILRYLKEPAGAAIDSSKSKTE